jgi:hypothetical protein
MTKEGFAKRQETTERAEKMTEKINTNTNETTTVEEAETSLAKYIDAITTALAEDYETLPQGVKNLFIYARQGDGLGLLHLCECYAHGTFFAADVNIAKRLLDEAESHGDEVARRLKNRGSTRWTGPIVIHHE